MAEATGPGSRKRREERLGALARARPRRAEVLRRIITGEMRTGVSDGLVLEAIAEAAGARRRRCAAPRCSSATSPRSPRSRAAAAPRLWPRRRRGSSCRCLPMLAEPATDWDQVLAAHGGRTGARVQVRRRPHPAPLATATGVAIWSGRLSDVTPSLPDVAVVARSELRGAPFILDGEVVALDAAGRPLPFQELMRRFRRVHGVEAPRPRDAARRSSSSTAWSPTAARSSMSRTRRAGGAEPRHRRPLPRRAARRRHGGRGARVSRARAGGRPRGRRWPRTCAARTSRAAAASAGSSSRPRRRVDCVIVAADRGSGRRGGWLSNYHLAVRRGRRLRRRGQDLQGPHRPRSSRR